MTTNLLDRVSENRSEVASSPNSAPKRPKRAGQILKWVFLLTITFGLLGGAGWLAFFADSSELDPTLLADHRNGSMAMATGFTLLNQNGQPAVDAIITLGDQQRQTNDKGLVFFDHLMLHSNNRLSVYYNGEHYDKAFHLHSINTLQLGWSNEFRRNLSVGVALALLLLAGYYLVHLVKSLKLRRKGVPGFKPGLRQGALVLLSMTLLGQGLTLAAPWFTPVPGASAAVIDSLPVPTGMVVEQDDNNAIVNWNGGPLRPDESEPANVMGYRVSWGVSGQPLGNVLNTQYRVAQLQPLVNGQAYQVQIQSVDNQGNLSKPSPAVTFTGSRARVDALRSQMNAFFDDFNLSAGAADELKWNSAYSACNEPSMSTFFVNTQYHAHNTISDGNCDRGQSISRARQIFDFTGRTGTITFDFDGSFRRDFWYLEVVPELVDITGQVHLDDQSMKAGPASMLRIKQNEQMLSIVWVDAAGNSRILAETDWNPYSPLDWAGLKLVSNVRRHWAIKIAQGKVEVQINGKTVLAAGLSLPFTKAHLLWNQFSYNTEKANQAYNMIHWDNFGFDGPPGFKPATTTYNYPMPKTGGGDMAVINGSYSTALAIPDAVTGQQQAERLMFTMQPWDGYQWNSSHNVVVNGVKVNVPQPKAGAVPMSDLVGALTPYTVVLNLPKGTLKQGANTLQFNMTSTILNLHAEIDYPVGNAPAYTKPNLVTITSNGTTIMKDVGPGARIVGLNNKEINLSGDDYKGHGTESVTGTVDVKVEVDNDSALQATGKNPGIARVELLLDKKVVFRQETNGAPAYKGVIKLNSSQFANGNHELFVQAYNTNGTVSLPDYFEAHALSGVYYPLFIKVSNANPGPTATPLGTAAPGATATATNKPATATAAPATATAVPATATATKPATVAPTSTAVPATATATKPATVAPTNTAIPATATAVPATATAVPATATPTKLATATPVPPTATPTTPASATNVLNNGGFENGKNGWQAFESPPFAVVNNDFRSGSKALRLRGSNPQWQNAGQVFQVKPNTNYTLTFWAKGAKTPYVDILDTGWNVLNRVEVKATADYTKYTVTFNSGNRSELVMSVRDSGGIGDTFMDDFEVK